MEKLVGNLYPNTIEFCRQKLLAYLPHPSLAVPCDELPDLYMCFVDTTPGKGSDIACWRLGSYLLWMLDQIPTFNDAEKRARWIGYVLFGCEALGLFTNDESRAIVREDVNQSKSTT